MDPIRTAAVAGSFYPAEAAALRKAVALHLAQAAVPAADGGGPAPKLLVVPHAGYVYSGDIAASAFARLLPLRGRITRVLLLGPTHRVAVRGLAVPTVDAFETPLGRVPIDATARAAIAGLPQVLASGRAHAQEHALEVQLPFLQSVLGSGWKLLPLAVGEATPAEVDNVLERLWGGDETLIVVSSDLSHHLTHAQATDQDRRTVQRILSMAEDLRGDEACGCHALNGALRAARRHALQPALLDLRNSGDTAGRRDRVVGYAAIAFGPAPCTGIGADSEADAEMTDPALGPALLGTARAEVAGVLGLTVAPGPQHPRLAAPGASFVTLHDAQGTLRGCIGRLHAERALGEDVRANALAAAFADPRFAPLQRHEWTGLQFEVSVLGHLHPLPPVARVDEAAAQLRPGIDGVLIEHRGRRGTFLPQVWSQFSSAERFVAALLRKAGLPGDAWSSDLRWWRYRVTAFEEAPRHDAAH
jgi:AmmeMemoRadiSam system protein B/AmmeMemoRadiSam system protein A